MSLTATTTRAGLAAALALAALVTVSQSASAQMMMMDRDEPTTAAKAVGAASVTAKIASIDMQKRTLDLDDGKTYVVAPATNIAAFKTGDRVTVEYTIVANFNVVASITAVN